jgi:DNA repair protein RecN (Recombination protein N)
MIRFLRIRNLATIEDLELNLSAGFSILTGETGAGKSIIIDSIRLVCGEKSAADMVRTGSAEATVEAIFSETGADQKPGGALESGESETFVQRSVGAEGSGKAYCDGLLVPLKKLKELTSGFVDIYGQNDHVFLLQIDNHLNYLDHFAGTLSLREETASTAQQIRHLMRTSNEWKAKERERAQRLDFLEFQIREIEQAKLKPGEEEELRSQRKILRNAERISALVSKALDIAYEGETALSTQLARLEQTLADLAAFDPAFAEIGASLGPLGIVVSELSGALGKFKEREDLSPERLEDVEERLSLIERLKRKYGGGIADIQATLEAVKREHRDLTDIQEKLARLAADIEKASSTYALKSEALSRKRKKAASELEKIIENEISLLGMKKARFHIRVETSVLEGQDPERLKDSGLDSVEFLISPNPGEELRPLRKIASGGELSRIMLALKSASKEHGDFKTLIFDEIDSGIGGKTAECIARKLKSLAGEHQVICITHLPQIASFAADHYRIDKKVEKNRTFTFVKKLDFDGRIEEIARLMTGSRITAASLESAREMLRHNLRD